MWCSLFLLFMEIKVPIEVVELETNSFHIITTVQIGCLEGDFIIDTGASVTVIDKGTPFSFETVKEPTEIHSGSVSGMIEEVQAVCLTTFTIGNHQLQNVQAVLIDLQHVNRLYEQHAHRRVAGLLGCDFLWHHRAVIDYENCWLILKVSV